MGYSRNENNRGCSMWISLLSINKYLFCYKAGKERKNVVKIYMDNCCYNRVFDDRSYANVYLEENSVLMILELVENGYIDLCGSKVLRSEMFAVQDEFKRNQLLSMYKLCKEEIKVTEEIAKRATEIRNKSNIRLMDSLHLACAEQMSVEVLLTTDKKFMNNANRIPAKIKVMNPTSWLMEVLYND